MVRRLGRFLWKFAVEAAFVLVFALGVVGSIVTIFGNHVQARNWFIGLSLAALFGGLGRFCWREHRRADDREAEAQQYRIERDEANSKLAQQSDEFVTAAQVLLERGATVNWLCALVGELKVLRRRIAFRAASGEPMKVREFKADHDMLYAIVTCDAAIAATLMPGDRFLLNDNRSGIQKPVADVVLNQEVLKATAAVFRIERTIDDAAVSAIRTLAIKQMRGGFSQFTVDANFDVSGYVREDVESAIRVLEHYLSGADTPRRE